ncbi:hypothetical protein A0221_02330 [Listeria monocytogenes]|nr:hypothetical protein [Listeria monocytogenes]
MYDVIVCDKGNHFAELLIDIDYDSWKYTYEVNTTRNITFTVYRTALNSFSFDLLACEAIISYGTQEYVIKSCIPSEVDTFLVKEITLQHIGWTCQNHVQREVLDGTHNYTIQSLLTHGFKNNRLGFDFIIHGSFVPQSIENLGGITAMDYLNMCVEKYGAYILANNKTWHVFDEPSFYQDTDLVLRFRFNTDLVKVEERTDNLKTVVKAYGKLKENAKSKTDNDYHAVVLYKSPQAEVYGEYEHVPIYDERFTNITALRNWAETQLSDVPEISLTLTYTGNKAILEYNQLYFVHEIMGYNTILKLTRMTVYHPFAYRSPEIGFASRPKDMVQIQKKLARSVFDAQKRVNDTITNVAEIKNTTEELYDTRMLSEVIGVVSE